MTHLSDLFDVLDLEQAIDAGYVRTQTHPTLPLTIHNYTELTQFERVWTPVTRQCRGLIAHTETGEVLARPFPKMHNHDEPDAPLITLDEPVSVTDKADGSLAIGYPIDDGYAIATRGSFASVQAIHATEVWNTRYAGRTRFPDGVTPLWEIIYPTNRIVCDYGAFDDLVLLGGIHIESGEFITPDRLAFAMDWAGPVVETFPYSTFAEMLDAPVRDNREGFVIRSLTTGDAVKWKYSAYVELHKLIFGMNERVIWEHLGNGGTADELAAPLPDEFHPWIRGVAARLIFEAEQVKRDAENAHAAIVMSLPDGWTRKDYAFAAIDQGGDLRPWLFNLLDGRDPRPGIWKTLRPSGAVTMTANMEDAA